MTNISAISTYFAARPTLRVDGDIQQLLSESQLQSLLVEETTLGLFRCEANFVNWGTKGSGSDYLYFDREILDFGKVFSVEFGPSGANGPVFAGRITGIEAHYPSDNRPELQILAEDRLQDLRMERRTRSFENVTDRDVINQIASQHGLTAEIDIDGPTYRTLVQVNQSDLAFLRERTTAIDAELWIDNRSLYVQTRSRRNAGTVTLTYGNELLEFTVLADLAHQRSSVRVSGWNINDKSAIDVEASESAIQAELNGGRSGSAVLARALAQRHERVVVATPISQQEAQKMAEARYRARARGFVRGVGIVTGDIRVRVGATLVLKGLGLFFDGPYYVVLARHTFTLEDGFRTTFEVERPGLGGQP
ncbi:phage late control D family protein [Nitrosomonas nitrosa]|uniref:phage late control D family protein n=1 Tax=Nitrosomonas nitrosa TaxID=52442 RepID=UPI0023F7B7E7|nr:contractile injection system protein, VgrG/Pvc8 family [Nitrosomonas nitrosa]MCO6434764.1 phage late control D family protein [Nitrosomonas nitrosa]